MNQIIIIAKKSFYQQSLCKKKIAESPHCFFSKKERTRFYDMHKEHTETIARVKSVVKQAGCSFYFCYRDKRVDYRMFDFVITIGGDGTFLQAARCLTRQVILGVNSDPKRSVGKFCAANKENFEEFFFAISEKNIQPVRLARLTVSVKNRRENENIVNDLLICDQNPAAMSRYILKMNNREEYQRSSGLWISTAAGSSGAIQSAGQKAIPCLCAKALYQPRELYYKYTDEFQLTGGLIDLRAPVRIRSQMIDGVIFLDGAHVRIPFSFGEEVRIRQSSQPLYAIGPLL